MSNFESHQSVNVTNTKLNLSTHNIFYALLSLWLDCYCYCYKLWPRKYNFVSPHHNDKTDYVSLLPQRPEFM